MRVRVGEPGVEVAERRGGALGVRSIGRGDEVNVAGVSRAPVSDGGDPADDDVVDAVTLEGLEDAPRVGGLWPPSLPGPRGGARADRELRLAEPVCDPRALDQLTRPHPGKYSRSAMPAPAIPLPRAAYGGRGRCSLYDYTHEEGG